MGHGITGITGIFFLLYAKYIFRQAEELHSQLRFLSLGSNTPPMRPMVYNRMNKNTVRETPREARLSPARVSSRASRKADDKAGQIHRGVYKAETHNIVGPRRRKRGSPLGIEA